VPPTNWCFARELSDGLWLLYHATDEKLTLEYVLPQRPFLLKALDLK